MKAKYTTNPFDFFAGPFSAGRTPFARPQFGPAPATPGDSRSFSDDRHLFSLQEIQRSGAIHRAVFEPLSIRPSAPFVPPPAATVPEVLPIWKRAIDVLFCLLALPVLAFWVLLMTVVTRLVSPGPVFFRQERIGHQGRPFKIFKFRTMTVGADPTVHQSYVKECVQSNAPMQKLDGRRDARLIPGGWLLRASGLDELPQLINVLRGDMSLVGPRPCTPTEYELYEPPQRARFHAVPGLTGLWQVSGKNRTTFNEMIRLDIHYAHNVSLPGDLRIIMLTPWVLIMQIYDTGRRRTRPVSVLANDSAQRTGLVAGTWRSDLAAWTNRAAQFLATGRFSSGRKPDPT